jgi:hypothetical protein
MTWTTWTTWTIDLSETVAHRLNRLTAQDTRRDLTSQDTLKMDENGGGGWVQ